MAGANRVALTLLDDLALLRHPLDDAVDRLLFPILDRLNVVAVAQISHTSLPWADNLIAYKHGDPTIKASIGSAEKADFTCIKARTADA